MIERERVATDPKKNDLSSGFTRLDFLLTFSVAEPAARATLEACCEGDWGGTRVGPSTWEISVPASPAELEVAIEPFLKPGDRAVFYYLADSKRFFRVVVLG